MSSGVDKSEGCGELVKMADFVVTLDGSEILRADDVDILPEIDVSLEASGVRVHRFVHRGIPSGLPETLHVGGWQKERSHESTYLWFKTGLHIAGFAGSAVHVVSLQTITPCCDVKLLDHDIQFAIRAGCIVFCQHEINISIDSVLVGNV